MMNISNQFILSRFVLVPIDRCNLRCKLCSEDIPMNKPEPDMTVDEARQILKALFGIVDHIEIMHISGGGEPFLHKDLSQLIEECMVYWKNFSKFIIFTNGTIIPSNSLLDVLAKYRDVISVRISNYGIYPEKYEIVNHLFEQYGIRFRTLLYHGENQDYGGWVDYGDFSQRNRSSKELCDIFKKCASYRNLMGNWRTRNGEVYFCSRAARGTKLGMIPKNTNDYIDLFEKSTTKEEKRRKFISILNADYLTACDYCSGDYGTDDSAKRYPAAEQL